MSMSERYTYTASYLDCIWSKSRTVVRKNLERCRGFSYWTYIRLPSYHYICRHTNTLHQQQKCSYCQSPGARATALSYGKFIFQFVSSPRATPPRIRVIIITILLAIAILASMLVTSSVVFLFCPTFSSSCLFYRYMSEYVTAVGISAEASSSSPYHYNNDHLYLPRLLTSKEALYSIENKDICHTSRRREEDHVILVTSSADHFQHRSLIRRSKPANAIMVFMLSEPSAKAKDTNDFSENTIIDKALDQSKIQSMIEEESIINGDIVQFNFNDTYHNLVYKNLGALVWFNDHCSTNSSHLSTSSPSSLLEKSVSRNNITTTTRTRTNNIDYVIKMDDDIFVDFDRLARFVRKKYNKKVTMQRQVIENSFSQAHRRNMYKLSSSSSSVGKHRNTIDNNNRKKYFIACKTLNNQAIRDKRSKWYVPKSLYGHMFYPSYCSGWLYLMNPHTIRELLLKLPESLPTFWIDDVYITGMLRDNVVTASEDTIALDNIVDIFENDLYITQQWINAITLEYSTSIPYQQSQSSFTKREQDTNTSLSMNGLYDERKTYTNSKPSQHIVDHRYEDKSSERLELGKNSTLTFPRPQFIVCSLDGNFEVMKILYDSYHDCMNERLKCLRPNRLFTGKEKYVKAKRKIGSLREIKF